jgi:hypothetical protein
MNKIDIFLKLHCPLLKEPKLGGGGGGGRRRRRMRRRSSSSNMVHINLKILNFSRMAKIKIGHSPS